MSRMDRRQFFASFVTVVAALKLQPAADPLVLLMRYPDGTIRSTARPNEILIVSGERGYLVNDDGKARTTYSE